MSHVVLQERLDKEVGNKLHAIMPQTDEKSSANTL